jgi:hypothetical protein
MNMHNYGRKVKLLNEQQWNFWIYVVQVVFTKNETMGSKDHEILVLWQGSEWVKDHEILCKE